MTQRREPLASAHFTSPFSRRTPELWGWVMAGIEGDSIAKSACEQCAQWPRTPSGRRVQTCCLHCWLQTRQLPPHPLPGAIQLASRAPHPPPRALCLWPSRWRFRLQPYLKCGKSRHFACKWIHLSVCNNLHSAVRFRLLCVTFFGSVSL